MTLAFVFPGQGSQSLGMLRELAAAEATVRTTFDEASKALGYDLWELVQQGPESQLNLTQHTQPAMLTGDVAVWRVWTERGGATPVLMAGHSLGEYAALVSADALDFQDCVRLVAARARCMQQAVPEGKGTMAAIMGLELPVLEKICIDSAAGEIVSCANLNAPGQIVIAGDRSAVERVVAAAKATGAKRAVLLPVSVPSHCALMNTAAEEFRAHLAAIAWRRPRIPVLHNTDVAEHEDTDSVIEALSAQLHQPVRWIETVQRMRKSGITRIVECGPGRILTGLCKRIAPEAECLPVLDPATLDAALKSKGE